MKDKAIIIYGGSRSDGNTMKAIKLFNEDMKLPLVDIADTDITFYDYTHKNQNDDYFPLMEKALSHDAIVLSTPIHWYNVSGRMKMFLDRLMDIISSRKDLSEKMIGKKIYVLVSFAGKRAHLDQFEAQFEHLCEYLKMQYGGCFFYHSGTNPVDLEKNDDLAKFAKKVEQGKI